MSPTSRPEKSTIFLRLVNSFFRAKKYPVFVTVLSEKVPSISDEIKRLF